MPYRTAYLLTFAFRNAFNRLAAAKELGIHKTTLFRRMKKLGISLPEQDGRTRQARIQ